jgi:hypothetical protein
MINKSKVEKLIHKLGLQYNMSDADIKKLVESPYEFTYQEIRKLDLKAVSTEEELDKLNTNFLYRAFGKIYVSFKEIERNINQIKAKNKFK